MFLQSQLVMYLFFFHFKHWLFYKEIKVKQIHDKFLLMEYKVERKKCYRG